MRKSLVEVQIGSSLFKAWELPPRKADRDLLSISNVEQVQLPGIVMVHSVMTKFVHQPMIEASVERFQLPLSVLKEYRPGSRV